MSWWRGVFIADRNNSYSLGISGAVATSSTSPAQSRRTLAPSPPIESSMKQCYTVEASSSTHPLLSIHPSDNIPLHDPGFIIFPDETADTSAPLGVGIGTPKSKRTVSNTINSPTNLAQDATAHIPSSASSSRTIEPTYHDDQENIPPTWSVTSTPSKDSARSTPSKSGASKYEAEEETYISSGGSGRRRLRKIERSKLGLESVLRGEENGDDEEDEEELTPGRREALARFMDKGKGKAKLAREIDRI